MHSTRCQDSSRDSTRARALLLAFSCPFVSVSVRSLCETASSCGSQSLPAHLQIRRSTSDTSLPTCVCVRARASKRNAERRLSSVRLWNCSKDGVSLFPSRPLTRVLPARVSSHFNSQPCGCSATAEARSMALTQLGARCLALKRPVRQAIVFQFPFAGQCTGQAAELMLFKFSLALLLFIEIVRK